MRKKHLILLIISLFLTSVIEVHAKTLSDIELGDYISMTPASTGSSISTGLTGCETIQTIEPKKLNLWRVIRKNVDGTVDVVSNYVTNEELTLCGETGYRNLISTLNTVANYYKNDLFTTSARYMGYKSQTSTIAGQLYSHTLSTNQSGNMGVFEASGGGDLLYQEDYDLINSAVGTLTAKTAEGNITSYWLASRNFYSNSAAGYSYGARVIGNSGAVSGSTLSYVDHKEVGNNSYSYSIRPIVTLKEGVLIGSGDGKSEGTAYKLKPSREETLNFIVNSFKNNKSYFKTKEDYKVFSQIIDSITLEKKDGTLAVSGGNKKEVIIDFDGTVFNFEPNENNNYNNLDNFATADAYYAYYGLLYAIGNYRGYTNDEVYEALQKVDFSVEDIGIKTVPLVGKYDINSFEISLHESYDESAKVDNKINVAPFFKINIDNYNLKDISMDSIDSTKIISAEQSEESFTDFIKNAITGGKDGEGSFIKKAFNGDNKVARYIRETIKGEDEEGNKNNRRYYFLIIIGAIIMLVVLFFVFSKEKKKPKIDSL